MPQFGWILTDDQVAAVIDRGAQRRQNGPFNSPELALYGAPTKGRRSDRMNRNRRRFV